MRQNQGPASEKLNREPPHPCGAWVVQKDGPSRKLCRTFWVISLAKLSGAL